MLRYSGFLVLAALAALLLPLQAAPPNVVLIISDDHGWKDYGFMGHPHVRTPNLDKLAAESLVLPHGYVPASLCSPSLASIITGRYPQEHRIVANDPPLPPGVGMNKLRQSPEFAKGREHLSSFMRQAATLPRLLGTQGYLSFQTGKWWQGHFSTGGFTHGMSLGEEAKGGRHGDAGLTIGREGLQPIYNFIDHAKREQKPFFVWYAPMLPHTPHNASEKYLARYRDKAPDEATAKYWANIEWFDETCGQLLQHLEAQGVAENTLVLYVADNGWIPGDAPNKFDARSKQSPYDGGLRTPILARWPGKIAPQRSQALATSLDFAPTILAAAGSTPPEKLPGLNLRDTAALTARKEIYGACFTHNAVDLDQPASSLRWRWLRQGDWKFIVPAPANEPAGKVQLFNLADDPEEKNNLAEQSPGQVQTLRAALDAWWKGQP